MRRLKGKRNLKFRVRTRIQKTILVILAHAAIVRATCSTTSGGGKTPQASLLNCTSNIICFKINVEGQKFMDADYRDSHFARFPCHFVTGDVIFGFLLFKYLAHIFQFVIVVFVLNHYNESQFGLWRMT
uniref:Uncharacterized protein n=1 Tax=Glossina austeni TaxID=7395 RepID=A0A1A9UD69_GLOAU